MHAYSQSIILRVLTETYGNYKSEVANDGLMAIVPLPHRLFCVICIINTNKLASFKREIQKRGKQCFDDK